MTNHATVVVGAVLSSALLPGAEGFAQVAATLIGTGLLTWIVVMQSRELNKLREVNRELNRELGKKCRNCELAQAANELLADAGKEHNKHTRHEEEN